MGVLLSVFGLFWNKFVKADDDKRIATLSLPDGIKEINNIAYTDSHSEYHLLDVYYPENTTEKLPVIIEIHGGGWMYGTKDLNKIYSQYLAERGFVVFNISYRLVPDVTVPMQLQDISRAIEKAKSLFGEFPCDTDKIIITGDSAGGQLAAFTAALSRSEHLRTHFGTVNHGLDFNCAVLTSPVAYMNTSLPMGLYCRMMWGEKGLPVSDRKYMNIDELLDCTEDFPPSLLITSSGDTLAREQTRQLYKDMCSRSIKAQLLDFPKFEGRNLPHVFACLLPYSKEGKLCIDQICEFIKKYTEK